MRVALSLAAVMCLAATPALAQQRGGLDRLLAFDANGDGAVTRAEAEAGRAAMFTRLDRDGDGYLSESERAAMQHGQGGRRGGGMRADTDRDGRISRAEMAASPIRGFDRIDANRDGVLSAEEIQTVRNRMSAG